MHYWIPVEQRMPHHHKVSRLARYLGLPRAHAVGLLVSLWCWSAENAQTGDLSKFETCELAEAAGFDGDGDRFLLALVHAGFVDPIGETCHRLHDWHEHGGKLFAERAANAERMREARSQAKARQRPASVQKRARTCSAREEEKREEKKKPFRQPDFLRALSARLADEDSHEAAL